MQNQKTALKITLMTLAGISFATGIGLFLIRPQPGNTPTSVPSTPQIEPASVDTVTAVAPRQMEPGSAPQPSPTTTDAAPSAATPKTGAGLSPAKIAVDQAVETILAPHSSFEQKQAAWSQLRQSGRLDQAINQLEERAAEDKRSPEIPASLGQAYLQKAGSIQDIREQGILGMKADQSFDLALNLDPENWEARFWKATAMSYWPPQLGKGKEVIEHLVELVRQQEQLPPKPEFAQVYALLGDQYQKQGYADYATQAWKRGLALFPNDQGLTGKLAESK
jgi:hypothetical protein